MALNVAKGLYMGGQDALDQVEQLRITHVMSVVNYEVPRPANIVDHVRIDLEDDEGANLLEKLPEAMAWLEAALRQKGMKVLVHCHAGTSRSAAVVAALIMKAKQLEPYEALVMLRRGNPCAAPNAGFASQLGVWADMGWRLDERHPSYKGFMMEQVARQYEEEGYVDPCSFAQLPEEDEQLLGSCSVRYRCRKCRKLAATDSNVIPPGPGAGRRVFRGQRGQPQSHQQQEQERRQDGGAAGSSAAAAAAAASAAAAAAAAAAVGGPEESSIFLEPMSWMEGAIVGPTQGKLYCPGCGSRLGSFNWAGITDTRGAWVTPAFQLHLSRLDVMRRPGPGGVPGLRLPALLAEGRQRAAREAGDLLSDLTLRDGEGSTQHNGHEQHEQQQQRQQQQQEDTEEAGPDSAAPAAATTAAAAASAPAPAPSPRPYFRHLVLDCDGVLVDSEAPSCESLRLAILEVTGLDIPHSFPDDFREVFGMDVAGCVEHYKRKFGREDWADVPALTAQVQVAKEAAYKRLTEKGISAFDGAADIILEAKALGMGVAVASSGAPSKIARNLSSSGLAPLLDPGLIVSAAHVARGKPAPDVYLEALRRLGCTRTGSQQGDGGCGGGGDSGRGAEGPAALSPRAIVIEDAIHGLAGGRAAGAFVVAVASSLPADVLAPHADLVVGTLEELVGRLASLSPRTAPRQEAPAPEGPAGAAASAAAAAACEAATEACG